MTEINISKEQEIVNYLSDNFDRIINKTAQESIKVYQYLQKEFLETDVSKNLLFQFVFRSFYRLDNAGLSSEFKKRYFELLEEGKKATPDFASVAKELYGIKNIKVYSLQISFTSKLIHTIQDNYPIYDSKVAFLMEFPSLSSGTIEDRIDKYLGQIVQLKDLYCFIDKKLGEQIDNKLKAKISKVKKIDFMLWSAGKLQMEEKAEEKKRQQLKINKLCIKNINI